MERRLMPFIEAVTQAQIRDSLQKVAYQPIEMIGKNDFLDVTTFDEIRLGMLAPDWLSVKGLVSLGEVMNSSALWLDLLKKQTQDVQRDTQKGIDYKYTFTSEQAASGIHNSNVKFARRAIALNLIASALGQKMYEYPTRYHNIPDVITGFQSASDMVDIYPVEATNPQQLHERFKQMFSLEDKQVSNADLFTLFVENNEFYGGQNKQANACTAPTLVKNIFHEYGRILRTGEYKKIFLAAVERK